MNVPFVTTAMVALVFAAVGWPAARLTARTRVEAWATLPATAGIACSIAVAASILVGTSMVPWLVLLAVAGWATLVLRRSLGHRGVVQHDPADTAALLAAAVVAILPVILVDLPPTEADARYMWWFHAAWYRHGGDVTSEAMALPDFAFRRPSYPPLLPGVIAAVWHLGDAFDREVALRVSQLFTGACVAAAGFFTARTLRLERRDRAIAAGLVAAACWGANVSIGLVGFVDLAWAALFVVAAVLLLAGPTDGRAIAIGTAFAAAAALVKFEGEVAALLLVGLFAVRVGRDWRRSAPVAATVLVAVVGWRLVPAAAGAPPDERGDWGNLPQLLDPGSEVHRRFVDALGFLGGELGWLVGFAGLAIVATLVVARVGGRPLRQPGVVAIPVLVVGYLAFVALTFAMAPEALDDFLDAAARRVVLVARMLVVVDALLVGVAAARALGHLAPVPLPEPTSVGTDSGSSAPSALRAWAERSLGGPGTGTVPVGGDGSATDGRVPDRVGMAVVAAFVLVRATVYAIQGAGLILDDWSIAVNGGVNRLWEDPNTTFALSRPGAWVLLTVMNGEIGARPLGLLAAVTVLQLVAALLLYRLARHWVTPATALLVVGLWVVMANDTALAVWGPIIPALVALCLLLAGALLLLHGRWGWAAACFCVGALCYETTLLPAAAATVVLPARPAVRPSRRVIVLGLLGVAGLWVATHPIYDVPLHLPALHVYWDAHFGRGLLGTGDAGALPAALQWLTLVGIAASVVCWLRGDRTPGGGPWLVLVGLALAVLGALGWVTLDPQTVPLGVFDRILVVSAVGAAAIWAGILRTLWDRARVPAMVLASMLVLVGVVGQVATLANWSTAGRDVEALLDHVGGLAPDPGPRDFVVGPSPERLDHWGVQGVYTEGFANDAATVAFGRDDTGSLVISPGPGSFTSAGPGTFVDWADVFGGEAIPYDELVAGAPRGYLEAATLVATGRLAVSGWAIDPSDPAAAVGITVRVDDQEVDLGPAQQPRPDVAAADPTAGPDHGFAAEVDVGPGPHLVCVVARNLGEGADAPLAALESPARVGTYCLSVPATPQ